MLLEKIRRNLKREKLLQITYFLSQVLGFIYYLGRAVTAPYTFYINSKNFLRFCPVDVTAKEGCASRAGEEVMKDTKVLQGTQIERKHAGRARASVEKQHATDTHRRY